MQTDRPVPDTPHKLLATLENFARDVVEASDSRPVLVDFWAPWCGPCQTLMPILDSLADDYGGRFLLAKVNTDEQPQIAGHFGIRSLPTVMLLHQREIVEQFVGVQPERAYRAAIDRLVAVDPAERREMPVGTEPGGSRTIAELEVRLAERPQDAALLAELAALQLAARDVSAAFDVIERLAAVEPANRRLPALRATHAFTSIVAASPDLARIRADLEADPSNSAARHALAAHHALAGDFATALGEWLELMRRDRSFGDGAARRSLVMAFDVLGDAHELTSAYRRKMANLLH
jgi:putative thioredoxin